MIEKVGNIKEMIELYKGDCLELMKNIPDKSIDMVLCDLPYGTTKCKWDIVIPFEPLWEQYNRIIKNNGAIVLFGSEPFSSKLRMSNLKMYKYDLIWEKERPTNIFTIKYQFGKVHENISVFYKNLQTYNPQMETSIQPNNNDKRKNKSQISKMNSIETKHSAISKISDEYNPKLRYPRDVLKFSRGTRRGTYNPTQKPIPLLEYLIKTYTNEEDTVLDNCMGSGSTGVSCVNTNRDFIGIELDKDYFNIANEIIKDAQKEMKRRLF